MHLNNSFDLHASPLECHKSVQVSAINLQKVTFSDYIQILSHGLIFVCIHLLIPPKFFHVNESFTEKELFLWAYHLFSFNTSL